MITVAVLINGQPIYTRTAVNKKEENGKGETKYVTDAGDVIFHHRLLGAVELAKLMLDTIEEPK